MSELPGQVAEELAARLDIVRQQIAEAASVVGRSADALTVVAVTKFQPLSVLLGLHALGVRDFGESRHQEARIKAAQLPDATWHFVGQLQTNKARQVREYAGVLHSIDRPELVDALRSVEPTHRRDAFLQVDLADAPGRGGAAEAEVAALTEYILASPGLRLLGVMAVAPLGEDPRRAFARLRRISESVRSIAPSATAISAGMSEDFAAAIAEGATHLRLGTAITGTRPLPG